MAWEFTLQDASFRGIIFEIVKTDDSAERAIAEHSYPYVDGADIEDMGRGANRVAVEAVFSGFDYETRLQQFLAVLDQAGSGEFIHPVFGSIKSAQVARRAVHHDADNPDYASVTIEFIESIPAAPFFNRTLPGQKAEAVSQQGALATAAATNGIGALIDRLRTANPLAGLDALRDKLTAPLLAISTQAGVVLSGLDVLAYPRAWGNDITALVGGMLDAREFGSRLTADWAGIQGDFNIFSGFSAPPSIAPPQVSASIAPTEAQAIAATAVTIAVNTTVGLADAASFVLQAEASAPTLSPVEIEAIVNTSRTATDAAIEQTRVIYGIEQSRAITEPLKDQALALQETARDIIAARPPLILRTAEAPGNMRLLAHLWYGDHARAAELYRMNGARNPFVNVGDSVNAYAN